jgi:hypothetical protein
VDALDQIAVEGPEIPTRFRDFHGVDICLTRQGHRCKFSDELMVEVVASLDGLGMCGYEGRPQD